MQSDGKNSPLKTVKESQNEDNFSFGSKKRINICNPSETGDFMMNTFFANSQGGCSTPRTSSSAQFFPEFATSSTVNFEAKSDLAGPLHFGNFSGQNSDLCFDCFGDKALPNPALDEANTKCLPYSGETAAVSREGNDKNIISRWCDRSACSAYHGISTLPLPGKTHENIPSEEWMPNSCFKRQREEQDDDRFVSRSSLFPPASNCQVAREDTCESLKEQNFGVEHNAEPNLLDYVRVADKRCYPGEEFTSCNDKVVRPLSSSFSSRLEYFPTCPGDQKRFKSSDFFPVASEISQVLHSNSCNDLHRVSFEAAGQCHSNLPSSQHTGQDNLKEILPSSCRVDAYACSLVEPYAMKTSHHATSPEQPGNGGSSQLNYHPDAFYRSFSNAPQDVVRWDKLMNQSFDSCQAVNSTMRYLQEDDLDVRPCSLPSFQGGCAHVTSSRIETLTSDMSEGSYTRKSIRDVALLNPDNGYVIELDNCIDNSLTSSLPPHGECNSEAFSTACQLDVFPSNTLGYMEVNSFLRSLHQESKNRKMQITNKHSSQCMK